MDSAAFGGKSAFASLAALCCASSIFIALAGFHSRFKMGWQTV
jgi:hypothetical protein